MSDLARSDKEWLINSASPVLPGVPSAGGGRGDEFVRVIDDLDRAGLNKYRHWKGRWPDAIEGVPDDRFIVRLSLHPLDHQFGVCNRDLNGSRIDVRKNGHWIERQTEVVAAIPEWLPDALR